MLSPYDAVLSALDAGVVVHAADTTILEANERARELLGITDLEGRLATDPQWSFLESDGSTMALDRFPVMQVIATSAPIRGLSMIVRRPSGTQIWLEIHAVPVLDDDGRLERIVVTFIDVTTRTLAEIEVADQQELLRVVLDASGDSVMRLDRDLRVEYVNARLVAISGRPFEEWIGRTHGELGYPPDLVERWESHNRKVFATGEPRTYEFDMMVDGRRTCYETSVSPEFDGTGRVAHVVTATRDVTQRKANEEELLRLATHDPLTGLANRVALLDETARALHAGRRSGRSTAALMIDLDRFKNVNDSLGHAVGDALLLAAAQRLRGVIRGGDLLARPGGDEFIVVMRDLEDPAEALRVASRLVIAFRDPFFAAGVELFTTASIGVSISTGSSDARDLVREADTAMSVAKEAGRDRVAMYNDELRAAAESRLTIEGDLRHALHREELAVWYQPEVDLRTGEVTAVEALLRWHHPDGTVWTADRFIDIAEDTGQILDIGDWVFRKACCQAALWAAARPDPPTVRVNASALQIAESGLLEAIDGALAESGASPAQLCLEITETALLRESTTARDNLLGLQERGIHLAVDDFGTGYASLTYLRQYPVDVIKIDRSFVAGITTDPHDRRLVAGIIAFARALDIAVTAEGVERPEQAALLRELGCPGSQGWLYSPAVPAADLTGILSSTYPRH